MTIRKRIVIWYTVWMSLLVIVASALYIYGSGILLRHESEVDLEERVYDALGSVWYADGVLRLADNLEFVDDGIYISVWDDNGNMLAGRVPDTVSALPFSIGIIQEENSQNGNWLVFDETPFGSGNFIIRGASRTYNLSTFMGSMRVYSMFILPFIVAFAAIGGYMIVRRAFRPAAKIVATAETILDGHDLSQRIKPEAGSGEIHDMALAFDSMLDRLEASFNNEKRFVSDASHELRTPISIIIAESEYALEHKDDCSKMAESMEVIMEQSSRMSRLISELLTIARNDNGTMTVEKSRFCLLDLAEMTVHSLDDKAMQKNITLSVSGDSFDVYADFDMLTRVIINFVQNSISYGVDGGKTAVRIYERNGYAVIEVQDDGIGIKEEDIAHIWDRFYQVDVSRSSAGSGLGLAIVKGIAEKHGGCTECESVLGKGSVFRFIFPSVQ